MKTLKFNHEQARRVAAGELLVTWRLFDDKDLSVNDQVRVIDQVDPERPETWQLVGTARINEVIEKHVADISKTEMNEQNYVSAVDMLTTLQQYYGKDVSPTTIVKVVRFTYQQINVVKDTQNNLLKKADALLDVKIYCDGGSRGNPGPSACGFVIMNGQLDEVVVDKSIYLGVTTNNQAEYFGLKFALEEARRIGARRVDVFMDSMMIVGQMQGILAVKNRDLWPVHEAAKELTASFELVTFRHVPREQNRLADAAVNRALDDHEHERAS